METPTLVRRQGSRGTALAFAIALALGTVAPAGADELTELKQQLEAARRSIDSLSQRIQVLEAERRAAPAAAPAVAAAPAPAPAEALPATDEEKPRIDIYGFVMLDAIYDFNQMDPNWKDALRVTKIPVNCPGDPGCGKDGEFVMGVRQSRFGIKGLIPTDLGTLNTKLEFELFGVGKDEGKTTPRLRHAWAELGDWGAGQTWSLFMDPDVFPNTVEYWGPTGMVFLRNPQIRWTPIQGEGTKFAVALESPSSALDTGKVADVDPSLDITSENDWPDLTAQWRIDGDWGHFQAAGIVRSIGYETTTTPNGEPAGSETGWGINLSTSIALLERDKIHLAAVIGEGIANYMNDGGVDLAPTRDFEAETVTQYGWLAYWDHYWNQQWSTSLGWSRNRQDNTGGQTGTAFHASDYGNLNLMYYPTSNVMVGGELMYGKLELKDGSDADDTRFQMSLKYNFD